MRIQGWYPNEDNITEVIEKEAMDRLEQAGHEVAKAARSRLIANGSVKTGKLLDSIRVARLKGDPKFNIWVLAGSRKKDGEDKGAFYAHMVENGTIKMPAKAFLRPALQASKGAIMGIMIAGKGSGVSSKEGRRSYKPHRG